MIVCNTTATVYHYPGVTSTENDRGLPCPDILSLALKKKKVVFVTLNCKSVFKKYGSVSFCDSLSKYFFSL